MKREVAELAFRCLMFLMALIFTGFWIEINCYDALLSSFSIFFIACNIVEWASWISSRGYGDEKEWWYSSGFFTRAIFRSKPKVK